MQIEKKKHQLLILRKYLWKSKGEIKKFDKSQQLHSKEELGKNKERKYL